MRALARVSGIGAVCHAGATVDQVWAGMNAATARPTQVRDAHLDAPIRLIYLASGAEHEADRSFPGPGASRAGRLAIQACAEALRDADQRQTRPAAERTGLIVGSCMGASGEHERARADGDVQPPELYGLSGDIAEEFAIEGPVMNCANACAAGAYAIGHAADLLAATECDRVVVVGVESYSRVALTCFNQMSAVDDERCRPFALTRRGTVFGEGAGALVLDRVTDSGREPCAARVDDEEPQIVLAGAGFTCDAGHSTAPAVDGVQARRALTLALDSAGLRPEQIGMVVPHGTGTALNDMVEADLITSIWPDPPTAPAVYSAKALIGHTGGGAGALAAVMAVMCLRAGQIPGNSDVGEVMPNLSGYLCASSRSLQGAALVNAYAFGGNNASLIFRSAS